MNCKIFLEKINKIPQNNNSFFIIQKSKSWNDSIELKFNIDEEIDYINLYFIIKSYILNLINPVFALAICYKDINTELIVAQKEYNNFIKKMDYFSFVDWINFRIKNDSKYEKSENFMYLIFMFDKNLTLLNNKKYKIDILEVFVPIYPWTENWYKYFKNSIDETEMLKNQNINNIAKIKILKKEKNFLKKKIKFFCPRHIGEKIFRFRNKNIKH